MKALLKKCRPTTWQPRIGTTWLKLMSDAANITVDGQRHARAARRAAA
jgi:hypothetical protein